jgi:hypothetical protein
MFLFMSAGKVFLESIWRRGRRRIVHHEWRARGGGRGREIGHLDLSLGLEKGSDRLGEDRVEVLASPTPRVLAQNGHVEACSPQQVLSRVCCAPPPPFVIISKASCRFYGG